MLTSSWRRWQQALVRSFRRGERGRPTRRTQRLRLQRLEDRTVPSVTILNGSGNGYVGLDFNQSGGYVPPDTCGAAGPSSYVETVNQTVAIYSPKSTGATEVSATLSKFWTTIGGLPQADSGSTFSDPIVTYDEQIGRFIVGDQDVDFSTHVSRFDIAVSKTNNPTRLATSDWTFYSIVTTESGFDADYPGNFGYNHDAFVITLNMFGVSSGGHVQVVSVNSSDLASGVGTAQLRVFANDVSTFSLRPTVMHDSVAGDPMWLVSEGGDNASINVYKMTNVLSNSAAFAKTPLAVASYSTAANPLNPDGSVITDNMDSRILKAAEANNTIVATHTVAVSSTQDVAQWYKIDVHSGTPTLADQGRVSAGSNTYVYFPSIDINSSGDIGMTYMRSGTDRSTDYMSMWVTGRSTTDPAGTMQTPLVVPAGAGQAIYSDFSTGGRAGDLSGINVDPVDGTFWAANEYANTETGGANWGTAIANFRVRLAVGAAVVSQSPSGTVLSSVGSLQFNFDSTMDPNSFSIANDVASFTGPGGNMLGQITGFTWLNNNTTLQVNFNPPTTPGNYTMVIGPQILRASDEAAMDQNENGTPGEVPGDQYTATFVYQPYIGPDGFGYEATQGPAPGAGLTPGAPGVFTILDSSDDGTAAVDLGSDTFSFYGANYTGNNQLFVGVNGLITFGSSNGEYLNTGLGNDPAQAAIAPLWDDWRTDLNTSDQVLGQFVDTNKDGIDDRLIIEWHQVEHYSSSLPVTFQAVLGLNSGANPGTIDFNYLDLDTGNTTVDNGGSATVGIKDSGTQGANQILVSYDNGTMPWVQTGTSVHIAVPATVVSTDIVAGSATTDGQSTLSLTYQITSNPASAFEIGLYSSADTTFDSSDTLLTTIQITNAADLTVGTHTKTFTIGSNAGQVPLPGAGLTNPAGDYYILGVVNDNRAAPETSTTNDTAVFTGAYHTAGGDVLVHGTTGDDTITVAPSGTNLVLTVNGTAFTYTATDVAAFDLYGQAGNDTLSGAGMAKPFHLFGGDGNDSLTGGTLSDTIDGGLGTNTLIDSGNVNFTLTDTSLVGNGTDSLANIQAAVLTGGTGNNKLNAGTFSGNTTLIGNAGNDNLTGGKGTDYLDGGPGNDTYNFLAATVPHTITVTEQPGAGTDLLSFSTLKSTNPATVTLGITSGTTIATFTNVTVNVPSTDQAANLENVTGGAGNDSITGNNINNSLLGGAGNDTLIGGPGDDTLVGGGGNDSLVGGTGNDDYLFKAVTKASTVTIDEHAGEGNDRLDFSALTATNPVMVNLGSATTALGSYTNCTLVVATAGEAANLEDVFGGAGNDNITGNAAGGLLSGGAGNDTLVAGSGRSILLGGLGADSLLGGGADDILVSGTTSYDKKFASLLAILNEWQSANDYNTRVAHILGTQSGGLNGANHLKWGTTVKDDGVADNLTGGAGLDWFFANLGPGGVLDSITDLNNGGTEHVDNS